MMSVVDEERPSSARGADAFDEAAYGTACFLCLRPFSDNLPPRPEHVVPRWLMRRFDLGNQAATVPGGNLLAYSRRTIPCCGPCNDFMAKELEEPVSEAFRQGRNGVDALPENVLLLWLCKLLYGTRFREADLRIDIADPASPPMFSEASLRSRMEFFRLALLSGPRRVQFTVQPASIFVMGAGVPKSRRGRFDLFVTAIPGVEFLAIRADEVFVMAAFGDAGEWSRRLGSTQMYLDMSTVQLHHIQCVELMLTFVTEMAAFEASGCYDVVTTGGADPALPGAVDRLFIPRFSLAPSGASRPVLDEQRTRALFERIGAQPPSEETLEAVRNGARVTFLRNPVTGVLAQAKCFEINCPDSLRLGGGVVAAGNDPCAECGAL